MLSWSRSWLLLLCAMLPIPGWAFDDPKEPPQRVDLKNGAKKERPKSPRPAKKKRPKKNRPKKQAAAEKKPEEKKPEEKKPEEKKPEEKKPEEKKPLPPPVDRSKEATTDSAKADADFFFQGEYMGQTGAWWDGAERFGLQVVALGDGKFDGILLRGGLPGAGWDGVSKAKLSGQRKDGTVSLANDTLEVSVARDTATVMTKGGAAVSGAEKWHRISATQDAPPPEGAIILFDGSSTEPFSGGQITPERLLDVGAVTKMAVGDFQLHLEFRTPYMPFARGQGRGNSGVYIQQRYEVQILDSFGLDGADNECGGLYKQQRPALNMCLPPLSWQTYDIYFTAARWTADGKKWSPARLTVLHNGEPIHLNYELTAKTGGGKPEGPELLPILLQNHGNPVAYRNIWIVL